MLHRSLDSSQLTFEGKATGPHKLCENHNFIFIGQIDSWSSEQNFTPLSTKSAILTTFLRLSLFVNMWNDCIKGFLVGGDK